MTLVTTAAENWINDKVEIKILDENNFEVQGYTFRKGTPTIIDDFEFTPVFSLEHDKVAPTYEVVRELVVNKWSTEGYQIREGDIERVGETVEAAVAKIVAMCY